jgi:sulfoxide reductase heme-binding subunit YedZ
MRIKLSRLQIAAHIGALAPLGWLIWDYANNQLGFNPIQEVTLRTGKYALVLLALSLACTPLNTLFGFRGALKLRRPLGLYAFMYAALHFLIFVGLDYRFDPTLLREAVFQKRYALIGFVAFLILFALAATSSKAWMKRLGKTWKRLHRLVYLAGILVVVHFVWLVKSDVREPLVYGAIIALLLVARIRGVRKAMSRLRSQLKSLPQITNAHAKS